MKVITLKNLSDKALKLLQEIGVLHVEKATELGPVDKAAIERDVGRAKRALTYAHDIITYLKEGRTIFLPEYITLQSLDEITDRISKIHDRFIKLTGKTERLKEETANFEELGKYLDTLSGEINVSLKDLHYSGSF